MFSSFSWSDFIICIMVLYALYYAIIIFIYYRVELHQVLSGRINFIGIPAKGKSILTNVPVQAGEIKVKQQLPSDKPAQAAKEQSDPREELNRLLEQIQQRIIRASQEKVVRQELLWMVGSILQQYHHLKNTDNIIAVNDFVIQLAENHCSISLTEADVSPLWN